MHVTHPPQIPSLGITRDVRLRFNASSAFLAAITYKNLLDLIGVAATATTGFDLFTSVRINMVEVWAAAVIGTATTISLTFDGATVGVAGDDKLHSDTSMGIQPAHIKARPDPRTQAGQFQGSATAASAFLLTVPAGAVIDVSLSFRNPVDGDVLAATAALSGATAGQLYYRGLDGLGTASTKLNAVGPASVL
jgi:hypothetical protein